MTTLDHMNLHDVSQLEPNDVNYLADFVNGLNRLDEETWERMREEMANE